MVSGMDGRSAREVLLAVEEARRREMSAQADTLGLAAYWCDLHGEMSYDSERRVSPGEEELVGLGGEGTPEVEEFAAAEFGAMRHQHPMAARNLMADALDLRHRLPRCWSAVSELRLETWVARKIASMTRSLTRDAARYVDTAIADHLESLPPGRLLALVEAKVIEADPARAEEARIQSEQARFVRSTKDEHGLKTLIARASAGDVILFEAMVQRIAEILQARGDADPVDVRRSTAIGILARPAQALLLLLEAAHDTGVPDDEVTSLRALLRSTDPAAMRAPVKLFVHLTDDAIRGSSHRVARVEDYGAITLGQLRDWLGHAHVSVTPVLDLGNQRPVDGYEFPARIKEAAHQLHPADAFPWSASTSRTKDGDHCTEYVPMSRGGPPGQTSLDNIAALGRHHHRIKTFGHWQLTCLSPGRYLWRTPHGFRFLVDRDGTHRLPDRLSQAFRPTDQSTHSPLEERVAKVLLRAA